MDCDVFTLAGLWNSGPQHWQTLWERTHPAWLRVTLERARAFADAWGSRFVEIGDAGHINGDSGYGAWPQREQMLQAFCEQVSA